MRIRRPRLTDRVSGEQEIDFASVLIMAQAGKRNDMLEDIFEAIFAAAPEAVWLLDADGIIITGNLASRRLSAANQGEQPKQRFSGLLTSGNQKFDASLQRAKRSGKVVSFLVRFAIQQDQQEAPAEVWHLTLDDRPCFILRCDPFKWSGSIRQISRDLDILEANLLEQKRREFALLSKAHDADKDRKRLEDEAMRDSLTSLPNRRFFKSQLLSLWSTCKQQGLPLAMLMIDVDHFKAYNDHFGHPAGDTCLIEVGRALGEALHRAQDVLARIGGEEFAVLLPNADIDGAGTVAERLRQSVESRQIQHAPVVQNGGFVTISVGCAVGSPCEGIDSGVISHLADELLYQAKQAGRNQIRVGAAESDWSSVVPILKTQTKPD